LEGFHGKVKLFHNWDFLVIGHFVFQCEGVDFLSLVETTLAKDPVRIDKQPLPNKELQCVQLMKTAVWFAIEKGKMPKRNAVDLQDSLIPVKWIAPNAIFNCRSFRVISRGFDGNKNPGRSRDEINWQ
jgi:hypothetical protein